MFTAVDYRHCVRSVGINFDYIMELSTTIFGVDLFFMVYFVSAYFLEAFLLHYCLVIIFFVIGSLFWICLFCCFVFIVSGYFTVFYIILMFIIFGALRGSYWYIYVWLSQIQNIKENVYFKFSDHLGVICWRYNEDYLFPTHVLNALRLIESTIITGVL